MDDTEHASYPCLLPQHSFLYEDLRERQRETKQDLGP